MNKEQRNNYSELHIRRMKFFERTHIKPIYNALQAQMSLVSSLVKQYGPDHAKGFVNSTIVNNSMIQPLQNLYLDASPYFAKKSLREIKASVRTEMKASGFGINPAWIQAIINFLLTDNLSTIADITDTTKNRIIQIINKGVENGDSVEQIADALLSDGLTLKRARLITRTELVKAMNQGHVLAEQDSPFEVVREWISAKDHRTRHSHREVDGEQVEGNEKFRVKIYRTRSKGVDEYIGTDHMIGPGDPSAHIENLANCRCTEASRAKRDSSGRIVRKQSFIIQS